MNAFAHLESTLHPVPEFFCEAPDGRKDWPEIGRQATLFRLMHAAAPRVLGFAIPNAGKRNPISARREGIMSGVFDTVWIWRDRLTAHVEMKGYTKAGRPGEMSLAQIEFGNRMTALGYPVACFFSPHSALDWLRDQGFPVRAVVG